MSASQPGQFSSSTFSVCFIQTAALGQNLGKTRALIRSSSTSKTVKIYRWISLIVEADDGVAEITDFKKTVHYVRL